MLAALGRSRKTLSKYLPNPLVASVIRDRLHKDIQKHQPSIILRLVCWVFTDFCED